MQEILKLLQKPLGREHIDFRIGSIIAKGDKVYATILAYKDARTDMKILDEATGGLWQNKYERDSKGVLQCGIAIKFENEWIWKWSNGIESNTEKEKGEYSDAFKRAGFMWGIGRDLYDVPTLFISLNKDEFSKAGDKVKATSKLRPNDWTWEISEDMKTFKATDKNGGVRVNVSESPEPEEEPSITPPAPTTATPPVATTPQPATSSAGKFCRNCGAEIVNNPKTGKDFCKEKCWLKKVEVQPTVQSPTPMTNADLVPPQAPEEEINLADIPF